MNFSSKGELKRAVAAGLPVILWSLTMQFPAITGHARIEGPWPDRDARRRGGWRAEVTVRDMQIVEVH